MGFSETETLSSMGIQAKRMYRYELNIWMESAGSSKPPANLKPLIGVTEAEFARIMADEARRMLKRKFLRSIRTKDVEIALEGVRLVRGALKLLADPSRFLREDMSGTVRELGVEGRTLFVDCSKVAGTAAVLDAVSGVEFPEHFSEIAILKRVLAIPRLTLEGLLVESFSDILGESVKAGLHLQRGDYKHGDCPAERVLRVFELPVESAREGARKVFESVVTDVRQDSTSDFELRARKLSLVQAFLGDRLCPKGAVSEIVHDQALRSVRINLASFLSTRSSGISTDDVEEICRLGKGEGLTASEVVETFIALSRERIEGLMNEAVKASQRDDLRFAVAQVDRVMSFLSGTVKPFVAEVAVSGACPDAPVLCDQVLAMHGRYPKLALIRLLQAYVGLGMTRSMSEINELAVIFGLEGITSQ
eukprot:Plantae.Rhodophyta-Rhodochaete_pulchella.ctg591.p1 GENE.Plantae.Rhodophyta-Rhodochaete_pulchella.ctg591~~Plantae.Rhodophyta-Rhodochaete_pulchella.ctg591.p1  ORF type:complete len:472 (+),score=63.45 Plantae.Rhodophyta-Rhodochaete_pulchella.ctg591:155-1417(+)